MITGPEEVAVPDVVPAPTAPGPSFRGVPVLHLAACVALVALLVSGALVGVVVIGLLGVPFAVGLWQARRHRGEQRPRGLVALALGGVAMTLLAVNYVVMTDGLDWPLGDWVFVVVAGPAAAVTAALSLPALLHRHARTVAR